MELSNVSEAHDTNSDSGISPNDSDTEVLIYDGESDEPLLTRLNPSRASENRPSHRNTGSSTAFDDADDDEQK